MSRSESPHTQMLVRDGDAMSLRCRRLRLTVERGPDKKLRHELADDRLVIGTHESCALVLTDPTVSRQHCEIAADDVGWMVRDLDSTNGVFLDHVRIGEVVIDRDVRLRLGDTVVRVTPLDERVDVPLPSGTRFGPLLGRSPAMRRIFDLLARVAPTEATVLITGESGTGKELAARAVHEASNRADSRFVVVDCGALPAGLIESSLFGHRRGAFTGAVADRTGAFEAASGGTLFLDEIGELPVEQQTRLLGALERRVVQPVGSTESRPVDVRVVAATNRDLRREVNRGGFREDLYFRLAVVTVDMPPLRKRPEDIGLYVDAFLEETPGVTLDADTVARLEQQPWPGNVRELRNVLERAAALGEVEVTRPEGVLPSIGSEVDVEVPFKVGKAALIESYERAYVERLMAAHDQNITRAARAAEIDRVYLLRLLDKYGLRPSRR